MLTSPGRLCIMNLKWSTEILDSWKYNFDIYPLKQVPKEGLTPHLPYCAFSFKLTMAAVKMYLQCFSFLVSHYSETARYKIFCFFNFSFFGFSCHHDQKFSKLNGSVPIFIELETKETFKSRKTQVTSSGSAKLQHILQIFIQYLIDQI